MSDPQIAALGSYYDSVPYESHPFPQTAIEHLESIAFLFGLQAPPPAGARVLELGCAAGANLIPAAMRHPGVRAVGVDLSPVQIAQGRAAVERAGLANVDLRVANIADIDASFGIFDYIVCHGVYSWVPGPIQDAILRICSENLAPQGVAYVSYNVHPGWKAREIVRDAMMLRGGSRDEPAEKLAYARGMIEFLQQSALPGSVLHKTLEEAMPIISGTSDHYLLHEFLEPCNSPCYFKEFVQRAGEHGLAYLAESDIPVMFVQNYGEQVRQPLLDECGGSQVMMEQYLDFIVNRIFRQTLLVKEAQAGSIRYRLDAQRLRGLEFAGFFLPLDGSAIADAADEAGEQVCRAVRNVHVTLRTAVHRATARILNEAHPATVAASALIDGVAERTGLPRAEVDASVMAMLEEMLIVGAVFIRRTGPQVAAAVSAHPEAPGLARSSCDAAPASGRPILVCNQWHEATTLSPLEHRLLPRLDGGHTQAQLATQLAADVRAGHLLATRDGRPVDDDELDGFMAQQLSPTLDTLRRKALLVA